MWAVNEADLSAQTASGYVHVMLHYGLGVSLAVADLFPLLPPPVRRLDSVQHKLIYIKKQRDATWQYVH